MQKYKIRKLMYQDNYGRDIKLDVQGIELRDNTKNFAGYWDFDLGKIGGITLNKGDKCTFFFVTDNSDHLIGEGNVKCDGNGGFNLSGKIIKLR
jgi:hypothetical protein